METTELERNRKALGMAIAELQQLQGRVSCLDSRSIAETLQMVETTLNPPPTYKEVTVERWECENCGVIQNSVGRCHCMSADYPVKESDFIKLTGTRRVPIKQPVRKRVSVEAKVRECGTGTGGYVTSKKVNAALLAASWEMKEALEGFEALVDLWLPAVISEEHIHEAEALHGLRQKALAALAKATQIT